MNDNLLITVIIPVYNVEKYLKKCVESVLRQTYKNLEIYLVDDGSTDGCPAICDEFAKQDSRITVIHKKNGGLSSARNAALDVCSGDCIMFVDSDDWIRLTMVEKMLDALEANGADVAICEFGSDTAGKLKENPITSDKICLTNYELMKEYVTPANVRPIVCNKLYRRYLFEKIRFPIGLTHEDSYTLHEILGQCQKAVFVKECFYYQYTRYTSITQSTVSEKDLVLFEVDDRLKEYYHENYPDLEKYVLAKKANDSAVLMERILRDFVYRKKRDMYGQLNEIIIQEYKNSTEGLSNSVRLAVENPFKFKFICRISGVKRKLGIFLRSHGYKG